jgi:hypothetical protein
VLNVAVPLATPVPTEPDDTTTAPLAALLDVPELIVTTPLDPLAATPDVIFTSPVAPLVDSPEPTVNIPVRPLRAVPVIIMIAPLVVVANAALPSAFAVDNTMLPVDAFPSPVDSVNVPPVDVAPDATPDVIVTDPPVMLS